MTIIKCKMCGGDIQRSEDQLYGTCDSCGSTMTFPRVSDEQRTNLFNRANHFRRLNEFDKAIAAYESILNQDDRDAEAHWGVVLSRFGIEYVEDPASGERIPTCRRVQLDSILSDADYLAALEYAPDGYSRSLYEQEAGKIAEIQKGILALSAKERPYDVFICYKESTDAGTRTPDSALAQDVYYQLTQEGYKVFFSRITLEDKLGQQYEPYIFAALNSAKVMVVVGTRAEHFSAVWVKNEWSRFLALMKKDRSRLLIPCYRGMDAYDLPEELSMLQSQDMGKIGFMQDLVRGIKKVVDAGKAMPGAESAAKPQQTVAAPGVQSLLTRARLFLEDGDFKSASEYADRVLDIDPKYAPAYLVRLQAGLNIRHEEDLRASEKPLTAYADFEKAIRFADNQQKAVYQGYNQRILHRLEQERLERLYQIAVGSYQMASDEWTYLEAAEAFSALLTYKDAEKCAALCRQKAEEARAEQTAQRERERVEEEKRRVRNKRTANIVIPLVAAAFILVLLVTVVIPGNKYQEAKDLLALGQYDQASEAFRVLGDYSDSASKAQEAIYQKGTNLLAGKQYDQAAEAFRALGDYSDSAVMALETAYQNGKALAEAGKYDEASEAFRALGDYSDSAVMALETAYQNGKALLQAGKYPEALAVLIEIKGYKDSASLITENAGLSAAAEFERKWSVGNTITFGSYEQDNNSANGKEPIRWRVLKREGNKALLISVDNIDCLPYNKTYTHVTWEGSTLRSWLNSDFLQIAFTAQERERILVSDVKNENNSTYGTDGGNDTHDQVFLLSIGEAEGLFKNDADRVAKNTAYAKAQGAYTSDSGAGWWWLRSPGIYRTGAANVYTDGSVYRNGIGVDDGNDAVRPALWIDLSSL